MVFETEIAVCYYKDNHKNMRSKRECSAQIGCSWQAGRGGGQCSLDMPYFDDFYLYLWCLQHKDPLSSLNPRSSLSNLGNKRQTEEGARVCLWSDLLGIFLKAIFVTGPDIFLKLKAILFFFFIFASSIHSFSGKKTKNLRRSFFL
jgi:hypothetical protein